MNSFIAWKQKPNRMGEQQAGRRDSNIGATEKHLSDSWKVFLSSLFVFITKRHLQNTERLNHSVAIDTNKQIKKHFWAISHTPETYVTAQVGLLT